MSEDLLFFIRCRRKQLKNAINIFGGHRRDACCYAEEVPHLLNIARIQGKLAMLKELEERIDEQ